jgi:DNA invertase Pin-like site-specific DNA recombinase
MNAIYLRVSTDDQSFDSQEFALRTYCERRGWNDLCPFVDKVSGAKTSRQGLDALLAAVRAGEAKRLIVFKLDRLGRSLTHLALILDELQRHRVALICTSQGIDTSDDNPVGRLQLGVLIAVAEFEREIIRERVNAGIAAAKARGVTLGRPATLEFKRTAVERLKARGLGVRAIGRELNIPASSVCRLLRTEAIDLENDQKPATTLTP